MFTFTVCKTERQFRRAVKQRIDACRARDAEMRKHLLKQGWSEIPSLSSDSRQETLNFGPRSNWPYR